MTQTTDIYESRRTAKTLGFPMPCGHGAVESRRPANVFALAGRHAR